jgi:hypothetical protein
MVYARAAGTAPDGRALFDDDDLRPSLGGVDGRVAAGNPAT